MPSTRKLAGWIPNRRPTTRCGLGLVWTLATAVLCCGLAAPALAHVQELDDRNGLTMLAELARSAPSHTAVEQRLLTDAADGTLNEGTLVAAALVASGASDEAELLRYQHRFDQLVLRLQRELPATEDLASRAIAVHAFLHRRVLGSYRTDATDVRGALAGSEFNCVSASVLYVAFANAVGVPARAVQLPEHVCCQVMLGESPLLIETTSRNHAAAPPGLKSTDSRATKAPRPLNDAMLLATMYYNRGVSAFDAGQLSQAIEFNRLACQLDPACRPARENLLAAINNRVVELARGEARGEALDLIERGLAIDPEYRPFLVNRAWLLQSK